MTREELINASRSLSGTEYLSKVLYSLSDLYNAQPNRKLPVI